MTHTVDQLPTFQGRTGQTSQHFQDFIASMWLDHKSQTSRLSACGLLWSCCDIMSGLGQACIMTVDRVHLLILLFHSYFVHFAFMFDFQLRTGEVTGRLIKSFQWIQCLFARFVYLYGWPNKQTNKLFQLCVLLGELLHSDASWWWQRRTELIPFQQLDVSFCFCLFEVEPCVGLFFCFVCFLKSLFLWISDHYHPLPLSVCVQPCPHPQTYWYLAFTWRQSY